MRRFFPLMAIIMALTFAPALASAKKPKPVTIDSARVITVDRYFSQYSFGPALRMYIFEQQKAVIRILFTSEGRKIMPLGQLVIFSPATSQDGVDQWINNQHSDAIFGDAPKPVVKHDLTGNIQITEQRFLGQITGRAGETYEKYYVTFTVSSIATDGVTIEGFEDNVDVHVMTKDSPALQRPDLP